MKKTDKAVDEKETAAGEDTLQKGDGNGADTQVGRETDAKDGAQSAAEQGTGKDPGADAKDSGKPTKGKDKADKKKDKDKSKERIAELEDKVKRQMAEFDNFRKRTEKEKAQMFEVGAKSVVEKILPVVDNFERGLTTVPEDENSKAFVDGMKMIYKQLMTELESIGVVPIEAVGKEFNPDFHNAVMQVESEEYESGVVAQELQKGYMYRDSVVRHSMVAVVQ
ncbi:MAG: nucleotide exchange factor GrpE [Lachnospiraceae bacterium]|nr:nucleotide exchange factor GrpE [Lachnospiraceae bacterium]